MQKLPDSKIIEKITAETPFEAVADDYSFTIKVEKYVPYICGAVHDGHQFRKSLWTNCLHTEHERWYEEDPCTKAMVSPHPIVIAGRDSRFEYDLNRDPENAIYEDAWGKKLWKKTLPKKERKQSLEKHGAFYTVVDALVKRIEQKYGKAIVFDMHSYNWKRWDRQVPTWNLGTSNIDNGRFGKIVESWSQKLGRMELPNGIPSTSKINDTFQGNGHFLKYITENFKNTLVLATEIAKVYCDEETGTIYPEVVASIKNHLNKLIPLQAEEFMSQK
jgi:hypothetical protein